VSFIVDAATGAFDQTIDRIRRNEDHGGFNVRPKLDPQQQAELHADQCQGRTDEIYRQCLTYHGFVWREVEQLPMLEGGVYRKEGEWRHAKLRLAFTPTDLASSFPLGAESLDTYLRDEMLKRQVTRGRVAKADLRKSRSR
jgi:hypothetical protein